MNLSEFQTENKIPPKQIIKTVQGQFRKYSKITHSMVCHSEDYGIQLVPEAEKLITTTYGCNSEPTRDTHKLKHRLSCRVSNEDYQKFNSAKQYYKYDTVQDFLADLVKTQIQGYLMANEPKAIEVKRQAEAGEYIKIVQPCFKDEKVINKVFRVVDQGDTGGAWIDMEIDADDHYYLNSEYVVLENYKEKAPDTLASVKGIEKPSQE